MDALVIATDPVHPV